MNANKIVTAATKQLKIQSAIQAVWNMDPILETVTVALVGYMGYECVTSTGEPLVNHTLAYALKTYQTADAAGETPGNCRGSYIKALLTVGIEVFDQHIVVSAATGDILWSPFVCGLMEFLEKYPQCEVTVRRLPSTIDTQIKTIFLMTKIIPPSLLLPDALSELFEEVKLTA